MKNALINIGLLCTTILIFFGGIEFALRITGIIKVAPVPPGIYQQSPHTNISYELIPSKTMKAFRSIITTNSLGFRGEELNELQPLIAILGDSITFGYGLQDKETIPAQLQTHIKKYAILNTASPGYNLVQQTAVYKEKIKQLNPKALILILHSNDLENGGGKVSIIDAKGFLRDPDWVAQERRCDPIDKGILGYIPGKCWLDTHSAFYIAMKKFINARAGQQYLAKKEEQEKEKPSQESITDKDLSIYDAQLSKLVAQLPAEIPRLFVIWPEWHFHSTARPKLKNIVQRHGFAVLDLYDHFGNSPETLTWDNVHPSAKTAQEAAQIISTEILKILP
jgi:lysophospholipase L1-like esterase